MTRTQLRTVLPGIAACAALLAAAGPASAGSYTYGAGVPAKSDQMAIVMAAYAKDLATGSKGSMEFKILAGGQIVSLENTLQGLRDGTIDAGFVVPVFTRKELKNTNVIYDTEVFGTDPAAITGAANETMLFDCKPCMDEFKTNGAVYLASFGNNDKGLICRTEVKTVADVKGLKVRAVGGTRALVASLGAIPVSMSPPDATTALERGALDCVHGVPTWLQNFGYWDVAKYVLETPLGSPRTIASIVWAKRTWDKMPVAERKIAIDACPMHLARMVYIVNVAGDRKIKEKAIKVKHVTFHEGGKDFQAKMAAFQKHEMANLPARMKKLLGVKNPEKIFQAFLKNLAKWEKMAKATNMKEDMNAMAAAYKKEIYDRLDPAKM
jgi:TRAP-type transport system periplasmic protein